MSCLRLMTAVVFLFQITNSSANSGIYFPDNHFSELSFQIFIDDNFYESLDRSQKLSSQISLPDPRMAVLNGNMDSNKDQVLNLTRGLNEEKIFAMLSPLMSFNQSHGHSGVEAFKKTFLAIQKIFGENILELEKTTSLPGGTPRIITVLMAPWEKRPFYEEYPNKIFNRLQRFAPGQFGFSDLTTSPVRDWAGKYFLRDEKRDLVLLPGKMGNLLHRLNDYAKENSAIITNGDESFQVPPYLFPMALVLKLTISPRASRLDLQLLAGLQPMNLELNPVSKNAQAEINRVGIPQGTVLEGNISSNPSYPQVLISSRTQFHQIQNNLQFHLQFGTDSSFHPFKKELELLNLDGFWKMSPYLSGLAIKSNFKIPMKVHLTEFDLFMGKDSPEIELKNLKTALDLKLPAGIKIVLKDGKTVDQAGKEIENNINQMISDNIQKSKELSIQKANEYFPVSHLIKLFNREL